MKIISLNKINHTINHSSFQDVYYTTYDKLEITDICVKDKQTMSLTGEVKARYKGREYTLPVFYHCDEDGTSPPIEDEWRQKQDNNSLKGGVRAFQVGDEAIALLHKGRPMYILGIDYPRRCLNYFRMDLYLYPASTSGYPGWPDMTARGDALGIKYFRVSKQEEIWQEPKGCCWDTLYIATIVGEKKSTGYWAQWEITSYGDWFIKVGPIAILWLYRSYGTISAPQGIYAPLSYGFNNIFNVGTAIWTKELEDNTWQTMNARYNRPLKSMPPVTLYSGFTQQPKFIEVFNTIDRKNQIPPISWYWTDIYRQAWDDDLGYKGVPA